MANLDPRKGSEYGGHPGRIQPPPHDPADSASEILGLMYATNPAGDTSGPRTFVPDDSDPTVPQTAQVRR